MPVSRFYGFRFGALAPGEAEIVQPYREELSQVLNSRSLTLSPITESKG
jgi:hypothetical protein